MRSFQERLRSRLHEAQEQSTERIPHWLRYLLRMTSGGDNWTAQFVRGLLWKYRWLFIGSLLASIGAGFAEAATLGIFTLALNHITALLANTPVESNGYLAEIPEQIARYLGLEQPVGVMIVLAVIFQLMRSGLEYAGQACSIVLRVWLEGDLQRRIFTQLVGIRYQQIASDRLGNLASYSTQVQEIGTLIAILNQLVNDLSIIAAYMTVLFWLSWQFTLIAMVAVVLLSLSFRRLRDSIQRSARQFLAYSVRLNERLLEYLQGLRIIHIFTREDAVVNEVTDLINKSIVTRRIAMLRGAAILPIFQSVAVIGVASFLGIGLWLVRQNGLEFAGALVTNVFIVYRIMPRLASFNNGWGRISNQIPYVTRIASLLDPEGKEVEYRPGKPVEALRESIEFNNVSFRYPDSDRDALSNVSFRVPVGTMTAIVGASGSGKSSIINLLLGIYRPTSGAILIDGVDLQSCNLRTWRRLIGVVDQDTLIFSDSVADNIRFGKLDATDEEIVAAAKIAHADTFIRQMPQGYQTEVGDRGFRMSGGQRQRIAIARAVIHDPTLLLFDEATSALDSQSERLIHESLEELRKTRTVIAIAHRLSTITKADQIIVLDNGQIVEQGSHHTLLAQGGRYAAMWQLQAAA